MSPTRFLLHALAVSLGCLLAACSSPQLPKKYAVSNQLPRIYPDYVGVTIPVNVAPLNFELLMGADNAIIRYAAHDSEILCEGLKARPDIDEWHRLAAEVQGGDITVDVYAEKDGQWTRFKPFHLTVSPDSIDPWMSYRMISPSYVSYEELTLNQRCLESFEERVFVDNMLCSTEAGGQCVNCHSFQQYNPRRMQFHARQSHGGTVIAYDGKLSKVDLAATYPAWHPWLRLIAYSTNKTMQSFHTAHLNKIEVQDTESDLTVYDIDQNRAYTIESLPDELETFPTWSPDGRWLYFCSAHFKYQAGHADAEEVILRAKELKYNIYRKPFNPDNLQFGPRELVFAADSLGMSATLPRISPDGRWLLFTMGEWGCFHIWHHDADLWLIDLANQPLGSARQWEAVNSPDTESYHCWSSNGRWVVVSSRRYDGVFTRPFFAHVGTDGQASKPFELPTSDPDRHRQLLKSYNVPELMRGPVEFTPQQAAATLKTVGTKVH